MYFYWGLWCFFFFAALLWRKQFYKQSYNILLLLIIILAVLVGGREDVGADWESYQIYYNTGYAFDKVSGRMEPLFGLLRIICFNLGFSYGLFCFVCCLLSLTVFYKAMKMLKINNCFLAFLVYLSLFFCNYQFNIIRHGILASFILLALSYLANNKTLKALICVLIGSCFQVAGLVFVPLVFFINKTCSKKAVFIIISVSFAFYLAGFSSKIVGFFPTLAAIDRISSYVDADKDDVYKLSIGIIGFLCIALYSFFFMNKEYEKQSSFRIMTNMLVCGFVFFCFFNGFSALVQRIGNLMNLGVIVVLPFILDNTKHKKRVIALLLVTAYLALYYPRTWNIADESGNYSMLPFKCDITNLI